jgi:preprotein translocase subunit SecG
VVGSTPSRPTIYKSSYLAILPVPMDLLIKIASGLFVCVALLMLLVILMQRPKSEGLGAAFGGGVTENIFGAQTTNVLTKITGWLAAFFFILTFALSILYAHKGNSPSTLGERVKEGLPPATAIASPTPGATAAVAADASPAASPGPSSTVGSVPLTSGSVAPSTSPVSSPVSTPAPSVPTKRR